MRNTVARESARESAREKTSFDYPLVINRLRVPGCTGSLGLTFCPGKKAPSLLDRSYWNRQLDVDIEGLLAWPTALLVSLLQEHEFAQLKVPALPGRVQQAGIAWLHLPIVDGGVPDRQFESEWSSAGPDIYNLLQGGSNVVLHCRGGLGRTGVVAAQLLIEAGTPAAIAIRQVRKARPNTIENKDQEGYLLGLGPSVGVRG